MYKIRTGIALGIAIHFLKSSIVLQYTFFMEYCVFVEHNWSPRPTTVTAGSDHYFHTNCPYVRTFQNFKVKRQSLPAGTPGGGGPVDH